MLKTVFVPALISLFIYLLFTFVIIPVYRRHHQRYAQYLPLTSLSERTSSIRSTSYDYIYSILQRSPWLRSRLPWGVQYDNPASDEDDGLFDEEEGEGLVGFDVDAPRREALARNHAVPDTQRRLSRDLEEGFRDDSDEEAENTQASRNRS